MGKLILVVDDIPDNIRVIKPILEEAGYTVRVATSGEQALKRVATEPRPNLVLLDIMMPKLDGYEVCRRLKKDPLTMKIPVIFVTAMGEVENEAEGFAAGAVDYITKPVSAPIMLARAATHLKLVRVDEFDALARSSIEMLGEAGHYNDTDTGLHIWRMAAYARSIAEAAGWSREMAERMELSAPMHDTGKIGIPDEILKAPRKLNSDEWAIMQTHSQIGADILKKSDHPVFIMAAEIALSHHERWDGSGYPRNLEKEQIPQSARVVAIADVFDALTMKRPYKEPWSFENSMAEIQKSAGTHLDPGLVGLFLDMEPKIRQIKAEWDAKG